jgi:prepilin-type N-terminal cleavage/methylation domain-containing protein
MRRIRSEVRGAGFTLVELLIAMVVIIALISLGFPALQQMIVRSRVEGKVREIAIMAQDARMEAIKDSIPTALRFDTTLDRVYTWVDQNADGTLDAGEELLVETPLGDAVSFEAPAGGAPFESGDHPAALDCSDPICSDNKDSNGSWIIFNTDGSVTTPIWTRFADTRGNYLQLKIWPIATAAIEIGKWDDTIAADQDRWPASGHEGRPWTWK